MSSKGKTVKERCIIPRAAALVIEAGFIGLLSKPGEERYDNIITARWACVSSLPGLARLRALPEADAVVAESASSNCVFPDSSQEFLLISIHTTDWRQS